MDDLLAEGKVRRRHTLKNSDSWSVGAIKGRTLDHHNLAAVLKEQRDDLRVAVLIEIRSKLHEDAELVPRLWKLVCTCDSPPHEVDRLEAATRGESEKRAKHDALCRALAACVQLDDRAFGAAKYIGWAHPDDTDGSEYAHVALIEFPTAKRLKPAAHRRKAILAKQTNDASEDGGLGSDAGLVCGLTLQQLERQVTPAVARYVIAAWQRSAE
eukprot:scaffold93099_cov66-Phaeocystis_antarctica.AAC.5